MSRHRKIAVSLAAVAGLAFAVPSSAVAGDVVKVRDACDPATFNAVLGPGACVHPDNRGSRVTFEELLGSLPSGHGAWSFTDKVRIDEGESLSVRYDRGGEFHTFSEVQGSAFGAGCVDELNHGMGLHGPPVVDCERAFTNPAEFVSPDFRRTSVSGLDEGTHRYMCAIHPWMRTTVTVR